MKIAGVIALVFISVLAIWAFVEVFLGLSRIKPDTSKKTGWDA